MTPIVTLQLSVEEVNGILQVLGKMPYEQSCQMIAKITSQAQAALAPKPEQTTPE